MCTWANELRVCGGVSSLTRQFCPLIHTAVVAAQNIVARRSFRDRVRGYTRSSTKEEGSGEGRPGWGEEKWHGKQQARFGVQSKTLLGYILCVQFVGETNRPEVVMLFESERLRDIDCRNPPRSARCPCRRTATPPPQVIS